MACVRLQGKSLGFPSCGLGTCLPCSFASSLWSKKMIQESSRIQNSESARRTAAEDKTKQNKTKRSTPKPTKSRKTTKTNKPKRKARVVLESSPLADTSLCWVNNALRVIFGLGDFRNTDALAKDDLFTSQHRKFSNFFENLRLNCSFTALASVPAFPSL